MAELEGTVPSFNPVATVDPTDIGYLVRGNRDWHFTFATLFSSVSTIFKTTKQMFLGGTPQTLVGAGVITVTETTTLVSNTGNVALSINDGLFEGQLKIILTTSATNTSTLTGINLAVSSIAFDHAGKTMILFWVGGKWWPLSGTATISY
jgi:hypothetical protein